MHHPAARRRLVKPVVVTSLTKKFQHTAARRRLDHTVFQVVCRNSVSTHSRPKAAGTNKVSLYTMYWFQHTAARRRLGDFVVFWLRHGGFQHTAARRRLVYRRRVGRLRIMFQHTAARRRLGYNLFLIFRHFLFQHTAARRRLVHIVLSDLLAF